MDRIGRIFKELETERDNLMSAIDQKDVLIKKIKAYLEEEVRTNDKYTYDDYDHEVVDDLHVYLCRGRAECAEGLLNQIEKWENE
jgi:hypothetical protein